MRRFETAWAYFWSIGLQLECVPGHGAQEAVGYQLVEAGVTGHRPPYTLGGAGRFPTLDALWGAWAAHQAPLALCGAHVRRFAAGAVAWANEKRTAMDLWFADKRVGQGADAPLLCVWDRNRWPWTALSPATMPCLTAPSPSHIALVVDDGVADWATDARRLACFDFRRDTLFGTTLLALVQDAPRQHLEDVLQGAAVSPAGVSRL